jgi:hypothetical protein
MTEYLCLTILGNVGESEAAFKSRLTEFWTHLLRTQPENYEKVYAEATQFGSSEGRICRQYMVETDAIDLVAAELLAHSLAHRPIDREDTYSKYEASSPDWFQIEH